ncbi:hypothetical protein R3P38DRAFT_2759625 [Favolaschia claudopus]|uniref:Uncharacterized protein n=1 Tax=Favolaschia claudopus TaxID=2862362 RepID=A0AAW0DYD0_9AGAR
MYCSASTTSASPCPPRKKPIAAIDQESEIGYFRNPQKQVSPPFEEAGGRIWTDDARPIDKPNTQECRWLHPLKDDRILAKSLQWSCTLISHQSGPRWGVPHLAIHKSYRFVWKLSCNRRGITGADARKKERRSKDLHEPAEGSSMMVKPFEKDARVGTKGNCEKYVVSSFVKGVEFVRDEREGWLGSETRADEEEGRASSKRSTAPRPICRSVEGDIASISQIRLADFESPDRRRQRSERVAKCAG